ncbi:hypothetical protein [Streptomyces phage phiSAJS1]|uniref:hypothetical protein n=1 Tax=Streptomyces phage phiSAJS1 TaxID=1755682 RepID=UPI000720A205|nr:hypothetical protein AVT91_p68 [Streptomyces phage phiSAJS1]ALO79353.1 hypothetical protein [Streptomyces phage phiSAJS1]
MKKQPTAKTPTVAIARVLRNLGLKQGEDFRVKGEYRGRGLDRERVGTYVVVYSRAGEQLVADNADRIEAATLEDGGYAFRVSIHRTPSGGFWTHIANFGQRVREGHVMDTDADRKRMGIQVDAPADASGVPAADDQPRRVVVKATLGAPRPAFQGTTTTAPDPYTGLAQKRFGFLYWACQEAGQSWFFQDGMEGYHGPRYTLRVYKGRARMVGWYLSGPGMDQDRYMGPTITLAAEAAQDVIMEHKWITERMQAAVREWPKGTRVQGVDSYGVTCMGTVNGVSWGVVTLEGHANYGKTWVDVTWDEMPHNRGTGRRNRPLTDDLIRH